MNEKNQERLKDILSNTGYGLGTTVGFTNDGKVFIVNDSSDAEGKPMQTLVEMEPVEAVRLATKLADTAQQALKAQEVLGNG